MPAKRSDKVVVTRFLKDAGVGNQMHQFAAGMAIAKRLGIEHQWDWEPSELREFGLEPFGIEKREGTECETVFYKVGKGSTALLDLACEAVLACKSRKAGVYSPFQSEECFAEVADEVREQFKLEPLELEIPDGKTPVAVHVRRGDYVHHPWLDITTTGYFFNGMGYMRRKVKDPHFFVVSDDPEHCTRMFSRSRDVTVMPPQTEIDALRTMVACKAHVISNSTFGWFGAWLGEDGPVVVPSLWHRHTYNDWRPVPDRWVKMPLDLLYKPNLIPALVERIEEDIPRAIVYPWKAASARWEELRVSMRSVNTFFEDKECPIFILGTDRPGWLLFKDSRVHYASMWSYAESLTTGVRLARKVLWMNDDICFLKPTTWEDCAVPKYVGEIADGVLTKKEDKPNGWKVGVIKVLNKLKGMGYTDQKNYSTHTPYVYEREKALDILDEFGVFEKFPMEQAYFHIHSEGSRPLGKEQVWKPPFGDARYLGYTNDMLTPELKAALLELLPDCSPWELDRPIRV